MNKIKQTVLEVIALIVQFHLLFFGLGLIALSMCLFITFSISSFHIASINYDFLENLFREETMVDIATVLYLGSLALYLFFISMKVSPLLGKPQDEQGQKIS